jgi:hypothetical protein
MGKLVIFMLVVGVAIGAYRSLIGQRIASVPGSPTRTSNGTNGQTSGHEGGQEGNEHPGEGSGTGSTTSGDGSGGVELPFIITAAKKGWVAAQTEAFNQKHQGQYRVVPIEVPSREAMHAILTGKQKPVLWSSGNPIWPARLAQAWRQKNGNNIVDLNDPAAHRVFLRSPLVFLTTKRNAKFLRPLLGTPQCWQNIRKMSLGQIKTPFGPLRFSHADPLTSSSGMLTLGLIMVDYAGRTGTGGNYSALATNAAFLKYLKELERGLIYDADAEKGTTALTKAFAADTSRYDFITAYEGTSLSLAAKDPNLAVIYPQPTAVSEHEVSILQGDWVSAEQKAGGEAFLKFLGGEASLQGGVAEKFRPVVSGTGVSLASELSRHAAQGFQQTFAPTELPPYEALNSAAYQWRVKIAKQAG